MAMKAALWDATRLRRRGALQWRKLRGGELQE